MKPALVVIDMQERFLDAEMLAKPETKSAIAIIEHVAAGFRKRGFPVVYVMDAEDGGPETSGFGVVPGISRADGEREVHKMHGNAFRETPLEQHLKELGADFIVLAGSQAEYCILAAAHGCLDRDLPFAVLRGAIVSPTPGAVDFVQRRMPVLSYDVALALG